MSSLMTPGGSEKERYILVTVGSGTDDFRPCVLGWHIKSGKTAKSSTGYNLTSSKSLFDIFHFSKLSDGSISFTCDKALTPVSIECYYRQYFASNSTGLTIGTPLTIDKTYYANLILSYSSVKQRTVTVIIFEG